MSDNKNQPAFPFSDQYFQRNDAGLSKREYIATEAMKGLLGNLNQFGTTNIDEVIYGDGLQSLYERSVSIADKLLKRLEYP